MINLKGIGASKGVAIGKAFIVKEQLAVINKKLIQNVDAEIKRLENAQEEAIIQLRKLQEHTLDSVGEEESLIFEVHQMILQDEDFIGRIKEIIRTESVNAEYVVQCTSDEYSKIFDEMEDPYMKERAADIRDISKRLIDILIGIKGQSLSQLDRPAIIVAKDLWPSDTVQMDKKNVVGFITEEGAKTSHTAILARTMQIPAVVGVRDIFASIKKGEEIIIDGAEGNIFINPDENIRNHWLENQKEYKYALEKLNRLKGTKSITKDGIEVKVNANIGMPEDVEMALENDAEGIGLFRSEFLYMNSDKIPSEEVQFKAYKKVLEKMQDKPVIIRTLDIGGDKEIKYIKIPKEENPFLGYRAIRISLDQVDLFKTQLRALLRASIYGNLGIMFPMISTLEELRRAKIILAEVKKDLTNEKIPFSSQVEVGIMIETPAAALISDELAKEADFFSIGTNDLTQYTIAVDRMNAQVAYLYDTHHPAVLKLIELVIKNGHKENIWVGICGEAAADLTLTEKFVAMGIDELSVSASSILEIRQKIQGIDLKKS